MEGNKREDNEGWTSFEIYSSSDVVVKIVGYRKRRNNIAFSQ
jgi:hypothetical protein